MLQIRALVLVYAILISPNAEAQESPSTPTKAETPEIVEVILQKMSLPEKIGQLFLFGFAGATDSRDIRFLAESLRPGGLIVFGRNIKTPYHLKRILGEAQDAQMKAGRVPLFFAVDQEGGNVVRIKMSPPLPSALSLGRANEPALSKKIGYLGGRVLRDLGINMNLAPVLDLSTSDMVTFVGTRSFGESPDLVGLHARELSQGLFDAGVIPTAKHFPGHGRTATDSHKSLPAKSGSVDDLLQQDLKPFSAMFAMNLPSAVMVAHMAVPDIDPSGVPATYSSILLRDVLRKRMGFNGLIITDDLEMSGAEGGGTADERAIRAFAAGADMVMVAWNRKHQIRSVKSVIDAVSSGRLSKSDVDRSVRRVLSFKAAIGLLEKRAPGESAEASSVLADTRLLGELAESINRVVSLNIQRSLVGNVSLLTRVNSVKTIGAFSTSSEFLAGLHASAKEFGISVRPYSSRTVEKFIRYVGKCDLALVHVTGPKTFRVASELSASLRAKVLVVNSDDPALVKNTPGFLGVIHVGSRHPRLGQMIANALWKSEISLATDRSPSESSRTPASEEP